MKKFCTGKSISAVHIVLLLLLLSGMPAACRSTKGNVILKSIPPGAEVVDLGDNTLLGITPCDTAPGGTRRKPKLVTVRFQKHGYQDRLMTFTDTGKPQAVEIEMKEDQDED